MHCRRATNCWASRSSVCLLCRDNRIVGKAPVFPLLCCRSTNCRASRSSVCLLCRDKRIVGKAPVLPLLWLQGNEMLGKPFLCLLCRDNRIVGKAPVFPLLCCRLTKCWASRSSVCLLCRRQSNCGQGPRVPFALLQVNEMLGKPLFDCSKALQRWKEGPPDSSCD